MRVMVWTSLLRSERRATWASIRADLGTYADQRRRTAGAEASRGKTSRAPAAALHFANYADPVGGDLGHATSDQGHVSSATYMICTGRAG